MLMAAVCLCYSAVYRLAVLFRRRLIQSFNRETIQQAMLMHYKCLYQLLYLIIEMDLKMKMHQALESRLEQCVVHLLLRSFRLSFSSLFSCLATNLLFWFPLTALVWYFGPQAKKKNLLKLTVHYLLSTQQQTYTVGE